MGNEYDKIREDLRMYVDMIKNPSKYYNDNYVRGVVILGEVNSGKTTLVLELKSLGVNIIKVTGSDLRIRGEKYLEEIFRKAKRKAPCIIFYDEINEYYNTDLARENYQLITEIILEQIKSLKLKDRVLAIFALTDYSNYPELIETGLCDRCIDLDEACTDSFKEDQIIKFLEQYKTIGYDVDMKELLNMFKRWPIGDIEECIKETVRLYIYKNKTGKITNDLIKETYTKFDIEGKEFHSKEDAYKVAIHEAGHSVVQLILDEDHIHSVDIIGDSEASGYLHNNINYDRTNLDEIKKEIMVHVGGKCAEKLFLNEKTIGPQSDIEKTIRCMKIVIGDKCAYGAKYYHFYEKDANKDIQKEAYEKIDKIVTEYEKETEELLLKNKDLLLEIANALVEKKRVYAKELIEIKRKYIK